MHCIAVQRDRRTLADLLKLRACETVRAEVPEDQVVVCPVTRQLVTLCFQRLGQRLGVRNDGLGVLLEGWGVHLQQLSRKRTNLVVVRSSLQCWEDGHVDPLLDVRNALSVLEEDHSCTRAAQGLVRGSRHDVAILKRCGMLPRCHETRDVGNVSHQQCANLICDLAELCKIHDARVCRCSAKEHGRPEDQSLLTELIKIDQTSLRMHLVGKGLEVD
mmetsp:Transcript_118789/g.347931  ORF Transcript_118789/g.347931 Transcript_118789/m.347931 type:complete len:217 (+) Transcript_118789:746-1396(+)